MDTLQPQEMANILHIMAKWRYQGSSPLAEAMSGEFTPQEITNTLWAFATMGTKPGAHVMGQLEWRAEAISGEFNLRDIANTLWAFAAMGAKPGERVMGQLERRAEEISGEFNLQNVANNFCFQLTFCGNRLSFLLCFVCQFCRH
jgi:hypothetical protein